MTKHYEFIPAEHYLLVKPLPSQTEKLREEASFALPEGYESEEDKTPHCVVKVLRKSTNTDGCAEWSEENAPLYVVERALIETIAFGDQKFEVIHQRHKVGELKEIMK